jgi:AcrR family transcriptional regulator
MTPNNESKSKRYEIIEVASKLFYEQGYNRTGVQQIIQEVGTAKGTFYSHFKSKEELGIAWLKARHTTWNSWLQDAISTKRSAKTKLLASFDFLGDWMEQSNYRGCAFLNTLCETPECDSPLRQEIAQHKLELLEQFKSLVADHHQGLNGSEQSQIATTLFLLFEGALVEMQNFRDTWPLDAAKAQAKNLL